MSDLVSIIAGGRRVDLGIEPSEAVRLRSWEWGAADQKAAMTEGRLGPARYDVSDWEGSRPLKFEATTSGGLVPGDGSGVATNRAWGRSWQTVVSSGAGDILTPAWSVDTSDADPQAVDLGCEVLSTAPGTVTVEVVRAGSVVASQSAAVLAGVPVEIVAKAKSVAGSAPVSMRVRQTAAASGVTLKARRPTYGVGVAGVYFDQYTPGCRRSTGTNYVRDPRMGTGVASGLWASNTSGGWTSPSTPTAPVLLPGSTTEYGGRCNATNPTATNRQIGLLEVGGASELMQVTPTETIYAHVTSHTVTAPGSNGLRLQPLFLDAAGTTVLATAPAYVTLVAGRQEWVQSFTVPADATCVRFAAGVYNGSAGAVDVYLTRMGFTRSGVYVDGASEGGRWLGAADLSYSSAPVGPVSRVASGEAWANDVLADLEAISAAVAGDTAATLVRSGDKLGDVLTFDLQGAKVQADQGNLHHRGTSRPTVELTTGPHALGVKRAMAGKTRMVGGVPVFQTDDPIPGHAEADAEVSVTFAQARRQMTVQELVAEPIVFEGSAMTGRAGSTTGAVVSSMSALPRIDIIPAFCRELPLAWAVVPTSGRYEVDLRAAYMGNLAIDTSEAQIGLTVDGVVVAWGGLLRQFPGHMLAPRWQMVRFFDHSIRAGQTIGIVAEPDIRASANGGYVALDLLSLAPVRTSARVQRPLADATSVTAGHTRPDAAGTLGGEDGDLGGTWTADIDWSRVAYQYMKVGATSGAEARIGSASLVVGACAETAVFSQGGRQWTFGIATAALDELVVVSRAPDGAALVEVRTAAGYSDYRRTQFYFEDNVWYAVKTVIDDGGRWSVWAGREEAGLGLLAWGSAAPSSATGATLYANAYSSTGAPEVRMRDARLSTVDATPASKWTVDGSGGTVRGDLPRVRAGAPLMLSVRGGGDGADALQAKHSPSSVSVDVTPRYTTMPGFTS